MKTTGPRIRPREFRAILDEANVTMAEIARLLTVSRQAVWAVVQGTNRPTPDFVRRVPLFLGARLGRDPQAIRDLIFDRRRRS